MTPIDWLLGGDTGVSSKTILSVMTGSEMARPGAPLDGDDFGRCMRGEPTGDEAPLAELWRGFDAVPCRTCGEPTTRFGGECTDCFFSPAAPALVSAFTADDYV